MKPLNDREARLLDRLERGFGWRLLAGPVAGLLGGLAFAYFMTASSPGGRFTLGDTSPAYAQLEASVGPTAAFYLLCMGVFMALGVFLGVITALGLTRVRRDLRARRGAAGVAA